MGLSKLPLPLQPMRFPDILFGGGRRSEMRQGAKWTSVVGGENLPKLPISSSDGTAFVFSETSSMIQANIFTAPVQELVVQERAWARSWRGSTGRNNLNSGTCFGNLSWNLGCTHLSFTWIFTFSPSKPCVWLWIVGLQKPVLFCVATNLYKEQTEISTWATQAQSPACHLTAAECTLALQINFATLTYITTEKHWHLIMTNEYARKESQHNKGRFSGAGEEDYISVLYFPPCVLFYIRDSGRPNWTHLMASLPSFLPDFCYTLCYWASYPLVFAINDTVILVVW